MGTKLKEKQQRTGIYRSYPMANIHWSMNMLQFKRGLGFPTMLNFAIYFLKKWKVKIREYPWTINLQQGELVMYIEQMQKLISFRYSGKWI